MRKKEVNRILEDNGSWLLIDISTPKFPKATMAVDTNMFDMHVGGRIYALGGEHVKYIYAVYKLKQKTIRFHRDVIDVKEGLEPDHINHGTMKFIDNRASNLRAVTPSQNKMNSSKQKSNTSGHSGICWNKNARKWQVYITIKGKTQYLGIFKNIETAIDARKQAENKYYGDFAFNTNKEVAQ